MVHNLTNGHAWILNEHKIGRQDDNQNRSHLLHQALHSVEVERSAAYQHLIVSKLCLNVPLLLALDALTIE